MLLNSRKLNEDYSIFYIFMRQFFMWFRPTQQIKQEENAIAIFFEALKSPVNLVTKYQNSKMTLLTLRRNNSDSFYINE